MSPYLSSPIPHNALSFIIELGILKTTESLFCYSKGPPYQLVELSYIIRCAKISFITYSKKY